MAQIMDETQSDRSELVEGRGLGGISTKFNGCCVPLACGPRACRGAGRISAEAPRGRSGRNLQFRANLIQDRLDFLLDILPDRVIVTELTEA